MPEVNYFWDEIEDNVIREYDENNNTIAHYTTEPELHGRVISQDRGGEVRHYKYDGQGNTVALTDNSGNITDTRKYSAFGEVTESTGTTEFPWEFGGRWGYRKETVIEIIQIRRRNVQPASGRWTSPDPLGSSVPTNTYSFVHSRPTNVVDPSGLIPPTDPLPQPWEPKPEPCCVITLREENNIRQDNEDRAKLIAKSQSPPCPILSGACTVAEIVAFIRGNKCCTITFIGHQGGNANAGGVVTDCGVGQRRVLPNRLIEDAIKDTTKNCRHLPSITIIACGAPKGSPYHPLLVWQCQALSRRTECQVFRYYDPNKYTHIYPMCPWGLESQPCLRLGPNAPLPPYPYLPGPSAPDPLQ